MRVEQPEHGGEQHFLRCEASRRLRDLRRWRRCHFAGLWSAQEQGEHEHDRALHNSEPEECSVVTVIVDHVTNGNDRQRRAGSVSRGSKTDRETTAIRKPFHRIADAGRIYGAATRARHNRAEIKHVQRSGVGIDHPSDRHCNAAKETLSARTKFEVVVVIVSVLPAPAFFVYITRSVARFHNTVIGTFVPAPTRVFLIEI